jgi:L-fucose mutarotase
MLIGLPPILGPDLLFTLRAMGHGDEIALVDGNYPAQEHARRLVRADGHGVPEVLDAILCVLPVDDFVPQAIFRATVAGDPDVLDPVHDDIVAVCARRAPGHPVVPLVGDAFYGRVRAAHTIVATSEPRLYGNVIVRKGVIRPMGVSKS